MHQSAFDVVDLDALYALARGKTDALFGHERLDAGAPERARMDIDISRAIIRDDKAEPLLFIEEFDLAVAHWALGPRRPTLTWGPGLTHGLGFGG
jgi:hypothetical protein